MNEQDRELVASMLELRAEYLDDLGRPEEAAAVRATNVDDLFRKAKPTRRAPAKATRVRPIHRATMAEEPVAREAVAKLKQRLQRRDTSRYPDS